MEYSEILEIVRANKSAFKRAGVDASQIDCLDRNAKITETYTKRINGRIVEREVQEVDARWYANVISSCEFFGDRISRCYTVAGYIPYKLVARNPYSEAVETHTREYTFS